MKMGRTLGTALIAAAAISVGTMVAPDARADTLYTLDQPNALLSPFPGPYATVNVHLTDATHATVTFTGLTQGIFEYIMGGAQALDVNVNASSFTVGGFTCTPFGSSCGGNPNPPNFTSGNVSAFGNMNLTVDFFDGPTFAATVASFVLTNTGGTWANDASVLIANSQGFQAAAHIFAFNTETESIAITGFAAVPAPALGAGLPGLVMACGGLLALARRRRQRTV